MEKSDFIKWLVKRERQAGFFKPRFVKSNRNSEDHWTYHNPNTDVDCVENKLNLELEGKVIFIFDSDIYKSTTPREKEFTYDEFVDTNLDEINT